MSLLQTLEKYRGGILANLEFGLYWGLFIGKLAEVKKSEDLFELYVTDSKLYRAHLKNFINSSTNTTEPLTTYEGSNGNYTISWRPSAVAINGPLEVGKFATISIPQLSMHFLMYLPNQREPHPDTALRDLLDVRFV